MTSFCGKSSRREKSYMKPETAEWVAKAEADYNSTGQLLRTAQSPHLDLVCYLCQQSAEKYLKARLCEAGITFPRTHDLIVLLELITPLEPTWLSLRETAGKLTDYAVDFRYPGYSASRSQTRKALAGCVKLRDAIRAGLGLSIDEHKRRASKSSPRKK